MLIFLHFFFNLYYIEFNNRQIKMPALLCCLLLCLLEKCTSFLCICFRLAASDKVNKSMQLKQKHWTIFEGMRFGVMAISICVCTKMAAGLLTLGALNFIRFVTEQPKISVGKCNQSSADFSPPNFHPVETDPPLAHPCGHNGYKVAISVANRTFWN